MSTLRLGVVKTLVQQDLYYSFKSTRGILFLVFFGVIWSYILWHLSSGNAKSIMTPSGGAMLSWMLDTKVVQSLLVDRSPTLAVYFLLAIFTMPMFVLFAASDQTANDIGSKYLRFLTPRCNRIEIFIGRFIGAILLVACAYIALTLIVALVAMAVDKNSLGLILRDTPLIIISLIVYSIPFVALMSLCSVIVGSAGLSALVGISIYLILSIVIALFHWKVPSMGNVLAYLLPNGTKSLILQLQWSTLITAFISVPIYVFVYGFLGWTVFKRRDI